MTPEENLQQANRRLIARLGLVVVGMFGFGFALVPLYDVFCDITGINGKGNGNAVEKSATMPADLERWVTVEFMAHVQGNLAWEFRPETKKIKVHPGQATDVMYYARNATDRQVVAHAVPSVAPALASKYFTKTECFCFTQQTLGPGEEKEMPVRFIVDPDLPDEVMTLTLSYTFFDQGGGMAANGKTTVPGS